MSSDSDRTIDSDELEAIIAQSQKAKANEKVSHKNLKRIVQVHGLSESESEEESRPKISKQESKKPVTVKQDSRPVCEYGSKCYRKNPQHKKEFYHPTRDIRISGDEKSTSSSAINSQCIESCIFYQFFVTRVNGIPTKYNAGISYDIKDLLSFEDGTLISSAQFNYMHDIPWLIEQYPEKYRKCPITIVHGEQRESKKALEKSGAAYPNVRFCAAKLDIPFGTHHTKMMFLLYKEGFRIVIHTSNLVPYDWAQKTQGIWISPLLPELKNSSSDGESPTKFKADLLEYVSSYGASELDEWKLVIQKHDFSSIKVVLIGSVPGRHIGSRKTCFGHLKLRKILNLHGPSKEAVQKNWNVIGQFSSIGSLGAEANQWLCSEFSSSLATCKDATLQSPSANLKLVQYFKLVRYLKLVFPSVENVRKSLEGYPAGTSLPYSFKVAQKQPYLKSFMHHWKSDKLGRSEACPHIKTYLRLSPDNESIAWFLVTSANLSKAAWGALEKKGTQLMIRSYELGVLYLPKYFGLDFFPSPLDGGKTGTNYFPVPYDLPLQPYSPQDEPWIYDIPHIRAPDRFGNKWCPP